MKIIIIILIIKNNIYYLTTEGLEVLHKKVHNLQINQKIKKK